MISAYFWKDGQVVPYSSDTFSVNIGCAGLSNLYCVDVSATFFQLKYGMYCLDGWRYTPLDQFPKEFLAMLLILGVPYE